MLTTWSILLPKSRPEPYPGLGLRHRAGEAVQDKALLAVGLGQTVFDDADDYFIGHQFPGIHVFFGLAAHFRPFFHRCPEDIAGGNLGDLEFLDKFLGLRTFARAWAAQQDQIHSFLLL